MSALDDRLPVVVGVGELVRRPSEGVELSEPSEMCAEVVRRALDDAGPGAAQLRRTAVLGVVPSAAWPDGDPGRRVNERLGTDLPTVRSSLQGGNGPQLLVDELSGRIAAGRLDAAVICGAEALQSVVHAGRQGVDLGWPAADPQSRGGEILEGEAPANAPAEEAVGLIAPVMAYPLIENALRRASGAGTAEHLERIAGLWSRFSRVAANHPCAWSPQERTTEEIATPSPANRLVSLPYTKLLNANIQVDQAAALVLCSAGTARALGVPRDRWVFVHAGAQAQDEWFLSERADLARSPALAACARALGPRVAEAEHVDLYSCFPSAVQLAARELALDLDRELTCTGGLTFFGGPGNNYSTHAIAEVVRRLRGAVGEQTGLVTAIGWYATKHALGLYGSAPPSGYEQHAPEVAPARREVAGAGTATAETCTVIYERDGSPSYGIAFGLADDGRRRIGQTRDPELMGAMTGDGFLSSTLRFEADGRVTAA